jgi:hypothetical protein
MAILKSADGKFYDVPDNQLDSLLIPAEQVKEKLEAAGAPTGGGGGGGRRGGGGRSGPAPQVFIQVFGGAKARRGGAPATAQACQQEEGVGAYHHCGHFCGHHCGHNCGSHCGSHCGSRCGSHCGHHCGHHCW